MQLAVCSPAPARPQLDDSLTESEIGYIFAHYDVNGDGQLQGNELDLFLGEVRSRSNTELLLQDFDTDGDSQLSLAEFTAMYRLSTERRDDVEATRWQQQYQTESITAYRTCYLALPLLRPVGAFLPALLPYDLRPSDTGAFPYNPYCVHRKCR